MKFLSIRNKFFLIITAVVFTALLFSMSSFATGESDIQYTVNGSELIISGSGRIPDYTSKSGAPWAQYSESITSVVIEEGITHIGSMSFFSFTKLKNVSIPRGLDSVGDSAFYNCQSLVSLDFPSGLTYIGEYAFERCTALLAVTNISAGIISEGAFSGCTSIESIVLTDAEVIDRYAFENCTSLNKITLSVCLTEIRDYAFDGCTLASLLYEGNQSEFGGVAISSGNDSVISCQKTWHYLGHDFSGASSTVAPTCSEEGYTLYICSCGEEEKKDVKAPLGHNYIHYTARDEADSHTASISYCTVCSDCIYKIIDNEEAPKQYTVTWIINNVKFTEKYMEGNLPGADISNMEYTSANGARYVFDGFLPEISPVAEDVTYTAVFKPVDGFSTIDGQTYYFVNGERLKGWQTIGEGKYYFLKLGGEMVTGVKTIGGSEHRFNLDGTVYNGWYTDDLGTKYYKDGVALRSWQTIEGKTYYFYYQTGLMVESETAVIGGFTRQFNSDHSVNPISGWQNVNGKIYYYRGGTMQTGWQEIDGKTYYFFRSDDKFGAMAWGWQTIGNKLYYFYTYKGTLGEGGYLYSASGYIGGVYYNIGNEGNVLIEGPFYDGVGIRYFDQNNTMVRNTFVRSDYTGGKKYYFGMDGYALRNCTAVINGKEYSFDNNGICID